MPVTLSIKNVPDRVARRLRERAARNRRSLQGELLSVIEDAAARPVFDPHISRDHDIPPLSESAMMIRNDRDGRRFSIDDLYDRVKSLGKGTPDEATAWIRQARSAR